MIPLMTIRKKAWLRPSYTEINCIQRSVQCYKHYIDYIHQFISTGKEIQLTLKCSLKCNLIHLDLIVHDKTPPSNLPSSSQANLATVWKVPWPKQDWRYYQLRLILKLKTPTVSPMTMTKTILRNSLLENLKIHFENLRLVCHIIGLID